MFPTLLVVVHVWTVLWLIAGVVGRDTCYWHAGGVFDRTMVRSATFIVLLTGLVAAWVRGWPILGFIQGGSVNWVLTSLLLYLTAIPLIVLVFLPKRRAYRKALEEANAGGAISPTLRAAINDPLVGAARAYEIEMSGALAYLMIAKPF